MNKDNNNSKEPWKWGDEIWLDSIKEPLDSNLDGTRYLAYGYDAQMKPFDKGDWVRYSDYARRKDEVERLEEFGKNMLLNNENLHAKVERLTKAGDAMHRFIIDYILENRISSAYLNKLDDGWLHAKEGNDKP
jgi:hypothetical protein